MPNDNIECAIKRGSGDTEEAAQVLRLHDALDANKDILNVYSNFDLPAGMIERLSGQN